MKTLRLVAVLCVLFLGIAACSDAQDTPKDNGSAPVSASEIPTMGSAELTQYLADHPGKPTLVLLWATWCPSCKKQIPEMEALVRERKDVNVLALSLDDSKKALVDYLAKKPVALPVAWAKEEIARENRVEAIPTMLIYNKSGKKIFGQPGVFPHSMLDAMVDKLTAN